MNVKVGREDPKTFPPHSFANAKRSRSPFSRAYILIKSWKGRSEDLSPFQTPSFAKNYDFLKSMYHRLFLGSKVKITSCFFFLSRANRSGMGIVVSNELPRRYSFRLIVVVILYLPF